VLLIVQKSAVNSVPTTTVLAYGRSWAAVASPPFEAEPPVAATIAPRANRPPVSKAIAPSAATTFGSVATASNVPFARSRTILSSGKWQ
jgi:hypothetical protein